MWGYRPTRPFMAGRIACISFPQYSSVALIQGMGAGEEAAAESHGPEILPGCFAEMAEKAIFASLEMAYWAQIRGILEEW